MKIVILGAGALGSLIAAHLARVGEEVTLIARGERTKILRDKGIIVTGLADFNVPVNVTDKPHEVKETDVLVIAVKTYDMEEALESVKHLEVGSVLSVQNGVLKNEQLAGCFGWEKTLGAAIWIGGQVMPAGDVQLTFKGDLYIGELPEGTSERVESLATMLTRAGISVNVSPKIQTVEWSKYVVFMGLLPLATLTRLEVHKINKDLDLARLMITIVRETAQLSTKLGIPLEDFGSYIQAKTLSSAPIEEAVASRLQIGEMMEAQGATAIKISSLQDLERGRRIEVEEILGYALRKGAELDIQLPTVETCYKLLTGLNRHLK